MKTALPATHCIFFVISAAVAQIHPVHDEEFISLGGINQWVTINGLDSSKPVILFLHGGPGSVMSAYDRSIFREWEKDFVLVHWDQRGAGRTFGRNAPADVNENYWMENPLTVSQMTADGIELAAYLAKHLGKQKIILIGTSWGTALGANMALRRPDLFYAYIGHSQIVSGTETLVHAYQTAITMALHANDEAALATLRAIGPPPYDDAKHSGQLLRIVKKYEARNATPAPEAWAKLAPDYDNEKDARHRYDGDDYSFIHYVGHKKLGIQAMSAEIDFMRDSLHFTIPVYLVQGANDILTPSDLTKRFFKKLKAPVKDLLLLSETAHGYNEAVVAAQYEILKQRLPAFMEEQ